jgi:sugar phosphate isomerase/epimerase
MGANADGVPERLRVGDGTAPPRLALGHSYWSLSNLAEAPAAYFPKLLDQGFEVLEIAMFDFQLEDAARAKAEGLAIIGQGLCGTAEETKPYIAAAAELGAIAINIHLGHAFMAPAEAADVVNEVRALTDDAGLLVSFETHRGRLTQDLLRTSELTALVPDIRFTLDLSHYWLGCEGMGNAPGRFQKLLAPILDRTLWVHGRVSDGEMVQADIGATGDGGSVPAFVDQWAKAMAAWRTHAEPGDVFLFEPELGPWPYAALGADGTELVDRWERSLVMTEIGQRAWSDSLTRPDLNPPA